MTNEFIFLIQTITISTCSLGALLFGPHALTAAVCLYGMLANLFVTKQIALFGLTATASDGFAVGAALGLNLLQEYFGKKSARRAIWLNFYFLIFYTAVSQIHLLYSPTVHDAMHPHFLATLGLMPRITTASFIAYLVSQFSDYTIYGLLKRLLHSRFLLIRNYGSVVASQFIDTVLFTFLGLYGIVQNPWQIILVSYTIKLVVIAISTPLVSMIARFVAAERR